MPNQIKYNDEIVEYWVKHYVNLAKCSLCGQTGIIDTRSAMTPAGTPVGRLNWCICPNGQAMRELNWPGQPTAEDLSASIARGVTVVVLPGSQ